MPNFNTLKTASVFIIMPHKHLLVSKPWIKLSCHLMKEYPQLARKVNFKKILKTYYCHV